MANFLDGVNRLLRINGVIRGDDDAITTFSDTQHSSDIQLAQIAIQDELGETVSDQLISYEKTNAATITLLTGTRTYALATDFVRFFGQSPSFYDSVSNNRIYEYLPGEDILRDVDFNYKTNTGNPVYWYWHDTTTKQVGFYNVPDASYNNRSLEYDYEKSVMVSNSTDTLPFITTEEYYAFITMAARRFRFMVADTDLGLLPKDPGYANAKARLANFLRPTNAGHRYGRSFR